jgi:hypothetical protein
MSEIHISDILGPQWAIHAPKIIKHIENVMSGKGYDGPMEGGNFFGSLKKIAKKAGHTLKRFVNGETKFKPSDLAYYTKKGINLANMALALDPRTRSAIPYTTKVAEIAGKLGDELKKHGRGMSGSGMQGSGILPKKFVNWIKKNKSTAKKIIAGTVSVAGLVGTALLLKKHLDKNPQKIEHAREILKSSATDMKNAMHADDDWGDMESVSGKGLNLPGQNIPGIPPVLRKCKCKKVGKGLKLSGEGLNLPGGKMKKYGTKLEVFNGGAMKTRGGKIKSDFFINKRGKLVSKAQSEAGKRAYERNNLGKNRKAKNS